MSQTPIDPNPILDQGHGDQKGLTIIPKWSIEHPFAVLAVYAMIIGLAIYSLLHVIPRRFAPYVQSPMIGVVTMMPGLSARDVEQTISKPIEEQLVNIKGVRYIRSTSQDGFSIVTLEFPYGTNIERATIDVQAQLNVAESFLPKSNSNLKSPFVVPIDPLNLPVLSLSLTGNPAKGWTMQSLRHLADNQLVDQLKKVPDVYAITSFGGYRRQLQILVNRDKLAAYHLSLLDVKRAVDAENFSGSAGAVTTTNRQYDVRVNDFAKNAHDVLNYPIRSTSTVGVAPQIIYIRDVAKVVDGYWQRRSAFQYLDHPVGKPGKVIPSIEVSVIQNPGASSATIVPAILTKIGQIETNNPGIHFKTAYSNAHFVNILFKNVWDELAVAIFLTGLAVLFFLGRTRSAMIAMITVPTSLAFAVLMMVPFGMTFNSGTLIGLLLSIGRLVDDSIIDIHAIERYLSKGMGAKASTILGISEVRSAVIASTLMIIAALVPLVYSGGLVGEMFVELIWPLIFGLLASMIVSFTLTPILASHLLHSDPPKNQTRYQRSIATVYNYTLAPFQRFLNRLEQSYRRGVEWVLRNRAINLLRLLATIVIGFTFYYFIGSEVMPLSDTGQASAVLEMEPGTSFQATVKAVNQVDKIMLQYPELTKASIEIGSESMFESWTPFYTGYDMPQGDGASMMLTFRDKDSRKKTIFQLMDSIQSTVMHEVPGIRRFQIKEMGSDVMATADSPIHLNIYGTHLAELQHVARQVFNVAKKSPDIFQPALVSSMKQPSYEIKVNSYLAESMGLTREEIAQQCYYALRGGLTNSFFHLPNSRQDTIEIRYSHISRSNPLDISNVLIKTDTGQEIPLSNIATLIPTHEPTIIEHDGLRRVVSLTAYYRKNHLPSMDAIMELVNNVYGGNSKLGIKAVRFPPGYGLQARGDMTQMMDSIRRLVSSLLLSLCLMYLILVAQFRGFLQPLQMMASLPLELSGVFIALFIAHEAFSTVSILGMIVLTGMDITTAVLLIDLIMRNRDSGTERDKAISRACQDRLRPILMTSIITLIVMIPVALAPKTGLDAYQPLATAVVGGLILGTILSLFDIPLMHSLIDDLMKWLYRIFLNREYIWSKGSNETVILNDSNEVPID